MRADSLIFLHENLRAAGNGVEIAGLRRAWLFAENLSVPVTIYTSNFSPRLRSFEHSLRQNGSLGKNIEICNLYENLCHEYAAGGLEALTAGLGNTSYISTRSMALMDGETLIRRTHQYPSIDQASNCDLFEEFVYKNHVILRKGYKTSSATPLKCMVIEVKVRGAGHRRYQSESEFVCDSLCRHLDKSRYWHMLVDKNAMYRCLRPSIDSHQIMATISPVIHSTHLRQDGNIKNAYAQWLQNPSSVDAIIVHTDAQRNDLAKIGGVADKLLCIPHTLPKWPLATERAPSEIPTVLYAARYEKEKRHELLFQAFAIACKRVPVAELHTYGTGSEHQRLQDWVVERNLQDRIHVHAASSSVGELCTKAWCGVLTSVEESFSLFTLECLAHSCPVVSFDINYGPRELLNGEQGGFLITDGDVPAFAEALVKLLSDPALASEKSRGAQTAAQRFEPKKVTELWATWYHDIVRLAQERFNE